MSRAFHPPETMSKEDIRKTAQVRRDIWTGGFQGLFFGSASGYILHSISKIIYTNLPSQQRVQKPNIHFNRNTAFLSIMVGGALGSYVLATTAGKNQVHNLHDVFEVGKKETTTGTTTSTTTTQTLYQQRLAKERRESSIDNDDEDDVTLTAGARKRILSRRKTVAHRLEKGHGLSDSHSGKWLRDDEEDKGSDRLQRMMSRRKEVARRLEEGKGISDSHGGKWQH